MWEEKPWRKYSILTELQHLLYLRWTLFVRRKGLCAAKKCLHLICAVMTHKLTQHCGQRKTKERRMSSHWLVFA